MGLFHTGRVHGLPVTFKSTMAEFRATRARHPEFPRYLILAKTLQEIRHPSRRRRGSIPDSRRGGRPPNRSPACPGTGPARGKARRCRLALWRPMG